jgi:PPM family protein phosphatase
MTILRSGSATDVGRVRKINEDLPLESDNLFAVADGMGGHVGGEVAARLAVASLAQAFSRVPTAEGLQQAFAAANQAVFDESQANPDVRGMGTTLTALALVAGADGRDTLVMANVGDSRAYVLSDGHLTQITADHSLAEERMRHGEMTEAEAAVHPQRHILTRTIGIFPEVEADMWELELHSGDRVILCSDGLSNEVGMDEMAAVLQAQADPGQAAQELVDLANERGGSDNITVVVVDVVVGEDKTAASSVVVLAGDMVGAPLVLGAAATTAALTGLGHTEASPTDALTGVVPMTPALDETMAVPVTDALAPGAQLGFSGADTMLSQDAPTSGEFFAGNTATVPLARSSLRVAPPRPTPPAQAPEKESRRERRRRLGIPRRITVRVILFALMVAAIPVAAFFVIRWYAYDNWFIKLQGNTIVIDKGYPNGVLWFKPTEADNTRVTTSEILPPGLSQIKAGVQESSLNDAKHYVSNLHQQYEFLKEAAKAPPGTSTIGPNGNIPNITAPTSTTTSTTATTTTAPGQTTTPITAPTTTSSTAASTTTTTVVTTTSAPST